MLVSVTQRKPLNKLLFILCLIAVLCGLVKFYPVGIDWERTYGNTDIMMPYKNAKFISPPWTLLFLPHSLLPIAWGNAVNFLLNLVLIFAVIKKLGGKREAILLTLTSPIFFDLARTNNIEWLPLLGLLAPSWISGVILSCKPQCLSGMFLIALKRDWRVVIAPLVVLIISFVVWGWWPERLGFNPLSNAYNFSILPIGIPYGIYLLRKAWREDDPYLAAVATPLFVPYIAPYSLVSVLAVLASRWPKAGRWMYFVLWAYAIVETRRIS